MQKGVANRDPLSGRMADAVAIAHDALCVTDATICRNGGKFAAPEQSFSAWCESIGIHRKAAERLLQAACKR